MLIAELEINSRKVSIGVLHLKAGKCAEFEHVRKQQISETIPLILRPGIDDGFLIGDFNFKDIENETNQELQKNFVDIWEYLHPKDSGLTFDLEKNSMAKVISDVVSVVKGTIPSSSRYDRILMNSLYWKIGKIDIIKLQSENNNRKLGLRKKKRKCSQRREQGFFLVSFFLTAD